MLIEQTEGRWRAGVVVNQVYAHVQETHAEFRHPRGGQAFYLRDTLYLGQWLPRMAMGLINESGVRLESAMRETAEGFAQGVFLRAPWEFNDLRRSGAPYVTRNGVRIYDRPPLVRRLLPGDLRLKSKMKSRRG